MKTCSEETNLHKILIADDEIYIRELIKRSLAEDDYEIFEASNGNEAIDILEKESINLLIIDIVMPHKGGIETLIELREHNSSLKIIAITGKIATNRDSVQGIAKQFNLDMVLEKPFDMFEFTQTVQSLLEDLG